MSEVKSTENGSRTAFPSVQTYVNQHADGLTKRELFAAMAMQGLLGNARLGEMRTYSGAGANEGVIAQQCVVFADALLAALKDAT